MKNFIDQKTEKLFHGTLRKGFPSDIIDRAMIKLDQIDSAQTLEDLLLPPSNHLEPLSGNRKGQYSIRINRQWRICFEFYHGEAYNVEIVDYH